MRNSILITVILALLSIAVFQPVMDGEFIHWDDDLNITGNPKISHLDGASLKWMFTDYSHMRRYIPMSWLTWTVTCHLFGLNSHVFHTEDLILHTVNILLVFWLLQKILRLTSGDGATERSAAITLSSAAGALLWGLHPMRVEVVAWANCQMYAQALLLLLASLACYFRVAEAKDVRAHRNPYLWLSVILFASSLLTYPIAIGYVAVLMVMDLFLFKRLSPDPRLWIKGESRAALLEKIPYLLMTLAVAGITLWARSHLSAMWKASDSTSDFGTAARLAQAFYIWAYYLWKPWISFTWSPVYTQLLSFNPAAWPFVFSIIGIVGATIIFWRMRYRWPIALPLWICHLVLLVPMLGLTEHPHYPNDRYNYFSAILWSILAAYGLVRIWDSRVVKVAGLTATLGLVTIFSVFSGLQATLWHDSISLFNGILSRLGDDPCRYDIYWRLGNSYLEAGKLDLAIENYSRALAVSPSFFKAKNALAETYLRANKTEEALPVYRELSKENPQDPDFHYNIGLCLDRADKLLEAQQEFTTALKLRPNDSGTRLALAHVLLKRNDATGVITQCSEVLRSNPDSVRAHEMSGRAFAMTGNFPSALDSLNKLLRLSPDNPRGYLALGDVLSQSGKAEEAVKAYHKGLEVSTNFLPIHLKLGWILAASSDSQARNGEEALGIASRAVQLTSEKNVEALDLLAAAYAETAKFSNAIETEQRAISFAESSGQPQQIAQLQQHLQLYRSNHALRQ